MGEKEGKLKNGESDKHKLIVGLGWREEKKGTKDRGCGAARGQESVVGEREHWEIQCPCESSWVPHFFCIIMCSINV